MKAFLAKNGAGRLKKSVRAENRKSNSYLFKGGTTEGLTGARVWYYRLV